jgi:L-fuconolactonase
MVSGNVDPPPPPPGDRSAITDAHVHVVSDDPVRFPRRSTGPGRDWWSGRAVDGDAVLGDLAGAGVARAVVVQAVGPYGNDNRYARSVIEAHPDQLAWVPAVDPAGDDPVAELEALMAHGSVGGVRLFGVSAAPAWLGDGRGRALWEAAADLGVTVVPTLFAGHLAALGALATQVPATPVALDHCGFPDLRPGPPYPGATGLVVLADCPSVHLKITSVVLGQAADHGGTRPFVEHLVEGFGPERLCWGSDHPQSFELTYPEMVGQARQAFATLDGDARHSALDRTARRLFWPGPS